MADINFQQFQREIVKLGFVDFHEQDTLWRVAQRCARKTGLPMAGMGAAGTAALGPGAALGFLAGLATGTLSCVVMSSTLRPQLKAILDAPPE